MLADDDGVHVLHRHSGALGDQKPQASRIQHGARPEDTAGRGIGRSDRGVGDDVDGIADEQDDGVRGPLEQRGRQDLHQGDIRRREIESRLPGFLFGTGGHHDHVRSGGDGEIVAALDPARWRELGAVVQIENFGTDLVGIRVVQGQRFGGTPDEARIRDCGAHRARADDRQLHLRSARGLPAEGVFDHGPILPAAARFRIRTVSSAGPGAGRSN